MFSVKLFFSWVDSFVSANMCSRVFRAFKCWFLWWFGMFFCLVFTLLEMIYNQKNTDACGAHLRKMKSALFAELMRSLNRLNETLQKPENWVNGSKHVPVGPFNLVVLCFWFQALGDIHFDGVVISLAPQDLTVIPESTFTLAHLCDVTIWVFNPW